MAAEGTPENPTPELSATLMLVRDAGEGLEVFMVKRHHKIDFVPGAMVFPGGKLDAGDGSPALRARCRDVGELDDDELALHVAAVREGFEECGVFLARAAGSDELISGERLAELEARYRSDLAADRIDLPAVVEREDLELATDLLVPFARWITPEGSPRRYDTLFLLAEAPLDHVAVHDGEESVDSSWVRPADAVAMDESGEWKVIFPTLMNVKKLGRSQSVAQALDASRSSTLVTVLPVIEGELLKIPAAADYDVTEAPLAELFKTWPGRKT